jgi:hypothetical protein
VHAACIAVLDAQLDGPSQRARRREPRRAAQDRADVDRLARPRRAPRPAVAPARQRADDREQIPRTLGELVVDARRHFAVALAGQQAVSDHAIKARSQLLRGDAG